MTSQVMNAIHCENAVVDVVTDKIAIKKKMSKILKNVKLPVGLMPVDDLVELGYNPATGFLRAIRKKKLDHFFKGINRKVTFDTEVTGYLEEHRMKKITGVKSREFMIWVSLNDFRIDDPKSGNIIFSATAGVTKTFPVSAFEEDEPEVEEKATEPVKATDQVEVKKVEAAVKPVEVKKLEESKKEVEVKN